MSFYIILFIIFILATCFTFVPIHIFIFRLIKINHVTRTLNGINILNGMAWLFILIMVSTHVDLDPFLFTITASGAIPTAIMLCAIYSVIGPIMATRLVSGAMVIKLLKAPNEALERNTFLETLKISVFRQRFQEQLKRGFIKRENEQFTITNKGKAVAWFYQFIFKLLKLDRLP